MDIWFAWLLSLMLIAISVMLHYQAMVSSRDFLNGSDFPRRAGVLIGMGAVMAAQIASVSLYAGAYYAMADWFQMGALEGEIQGGFLDYFYFSLMSYTTLGVGDIHPMGAIRIVSGLEALNGFALIGWTASFAYTLMRNGWED